MRMFNILKKKSMMNPITLMRKTMKRHKIMIMQKMMMTNISKNILNLNMIPRSMKLNIKKKIMNHHMRK